MEHDKSESEGCGQGIQHMLGALNPLNSSSNGNDGAGEPSSKSPLIDSRDAATTPVSEDGKIRCSRLHQVLYDIFVVPCLISHSSFAPFDQIRVCPG